MMLYMHLGCELDGNDASTMFIDTWIHATPLMARLAMMHRIFDI